MILGNASWGFRETPLEKQLEITKNMGLTLLELDIANHENDALQLDSSDEQIAAVKALYEKYSISIDCCATGDDFTSENTDDCYLSLENVKRVIDICAKLGAKYLRVFAGFSPVAEVVGARWDVMIDCLCKVGEYAKKNNIIPVIETHGGVDGYDDGVVHFLSTSSDPDTLIKMMSQLPKSLTLNFDPANLFAVGVKNPESVYNALKDRITYIHLKDFVTLPETGHLLPAACGESNMDWKSLFAAIKDFDGPALFEYENVEDVEAGCRRSLDFIKSLL